RSRASIRGVDHRRTDRLESDAVGQCSCRVRPLAGPRHSRMSAVRGPDAPIATPRFVPNALTVDLEEWFHVCGVEALGPAQWDRLPARIMPTTLWLLDLLGRRQV